MPEDPTLNDLAQTVVQKLSAAGKTVSTAESCTGGWIAKTITDIPGSSAAFGYGIVSYSNGAKESLVGVRNETLEEHGSVSEPVVREMAEGALHLSGSDIAIAVSGVAGPDGGTDAKPVGTVWFAWAIREHGNERIETSLQNFNGDRELIRELTVAHALQGVIERIGQ